MLSTVIKFPVMFISGVFVPVSHLPVFARTIAMFSPLTYFTDIARYAAGGEHYFPLIVDFLAFLAFTLLFWVIAVKSHNKILPMRV